MKRAITIIIAVMFLSGINQCISNNVNIDSAPKMTGQDATNNTTFIKFDLSWENSWRTSSGSANWDAVWIFVKYRRQSDPSTWMMLPASLSTNPSDYSITNNNGVAATFSPSSDGLGVFVYRSSDGTGSINWDGIKIKWNYGLGVPSWGIAGPGDNDRVEIKVFAIEMVYVPTGSFYVGDGGTGYYQFAQTQITTADATVAGGYPASCDGACVLTAPTVSNYPNAYNAFYCMKYEISQQGYCDFLNSLNYDRQKYRTSCGTGCGASDRPPSAAAGTRVFYNTYDDHTGNGIKVQTPGTSNTVPAVYGVDFANRMNDTWGSSNGGDIAMDLITITDWYAYTDWAGLRPMTELEFEKAARGPGVPVTNELAWGLANNASNLYATGYGVFNTLQPLNPGLANEVPNSPSGTMGNASYYNTMWRNGEGDWPTYSIVRPIRCGAFATGSTNRTTSGASYYGIMELSGNMSELCQSIYNWFGFMNQGGDLTTGTNGDGMLNDNTDNAAYFAFSGFAGCDIISIRGGTFFSQSQNLNISHRYGTHSPSFSPAENFAPIATASSGCSMTNRFRGLVGFRCVRTAP